MAAVSFLETTNLVGLGLSADRVYSHVTDLNGSGDSSISAASHARSAASAGGLKIMSDVVDSSYRVLDGIGRLWQRTTDSEKGPLKKFLEVKSVDDLKIGEVAELLADYKRLAAILKQANYS
ncbi:hypothetical protein J3Q64DRAFT_1647115 [Phycomyces blakesleeanus]|uniref:Uncharacterized protein n=1 Tax=Phycomyces blakesleeanus TaxID=4837 RepID=A0ABR3AM00_PHYBL